MTLEIGPDISEINLADSNRYFIKFSAVIAGYLTTTPCFSSYFEGWLEP